MEHFEVQNGHGTRTYYKERNRIYFTEREMYGPGTITHTVLEADVEAIITVWNELGALYRLGKAAKLAEIQQLLGIRK